MFHIKHRSDCVLVGVVYSLGRKEYGRLGLGENDLEEKSKPTVVPKLRSKKCVHVSCGTAVSYAVDSDGVCYFFFTVRLILKRGLSCS